MELLAPFKINFMCEHLNGFLPWFQQKIKSHDILEKNPESFLNREILKWWLDEYFMQRFLRIKKVSFFEFPVVTERHSI